MKLSRLWTVCGSLRCAVLLMLEMMKSYCNTIMLSILLLHQFFFTSTFVVELMKIMTYLIDVSYRLGGISFLYLLTILLLNYNVWTWCSLRYSVFEHTVELSFSYFSGSLFNELVLMNHFKLFQIIINFLKNFHKWISQKNRYLKRSNSKLLPFFYLKYISFFNITMITSRE